MADVRQAHMPGNYELYDPTENKLGPVICKFCWEQARVQNSASLSTVWVSLEEKRMVWWLCGSHEASVKSEGSMFTFLKSASGVLASPGI
jgi:hypothetical protein